MDRRRQQAHERISGASGGRGVGKGETLNWPEHIGSVITGDCLDVLRTIPDGVVHCCVTSPPYWGLRDYGTAIWEGGDPKCEHKQGRNGAGRADGIVDQRGQRNRDGVGSMGGDCRKCGAVRIDNQIGHEPTPEKYVARLVEVFREVWRVLRDDGTLWLNLGDSYAGSWGTMSHDLNGKAKPSGYNERPPQSFIKSKRPPRKSNRRDKAEVIPGRWGGGNMPAINGLKPKDLCGTPWRLALALQRPWLRCRGCGAEAHSDAWGRFPGGRMICPSCKKSKGHEISKLGWWLRQDIVWSKPNPMPESVTDRCTKAHEYLFLLTKSEKYYYDQEAIKIVKAPSTTQDIRDNKNGKRRERNYPGSASVGGTNLGGPIGLYNRRSVWTIPTEPTPYAHFATFPQKLVEPCIMAGSSEKGNCSECGKPWVRQVERSKTFESGSGKSGNPIAGKHGETCQGGGDTGDIRRGPCISTKTIGWCPSCDCDAPTEPPIILDPFSGSGTTGVVAKRLGRRHILIDLSAVYNTIAEQLLAQRELFNQPQKVRS